MGTTPTLRVADAFETLEEEKMGAIAQKEKTKLKQWRPSSVLDILI
jgi:hypothetical protein